MGDKRLVAVMNSLSVPNLAAMLSTRVCKELTIK